MHKKFQLKHISATGTIVSTIKKPNSAGWFETMVFNNEGNCIYEKCISNKEDAKAFHLKTCYKFRAYLESR